MIWQLNIPPTEIAMVLLCMSANLLMNEPKKASDVTLFHQFVSGDFKISIKVFHFDSPIERQRTTHNLKTIKKPTNQQQRTINHFDFFGWQFTINSLNASTSIIFKLIFFLLSNLFAFYFGSFVSLLLLLLFISLYLSALH